MPRTKPVNVEKGRKGFQPTVVGAVPPSASDAPERRTAVVVLDSPHATGSDYEGSYAAFQNLRGIDPELLDAIERTQSAIDDEIERLPALRDTYEQTYAATTSAMNERDKYRDQRREQREKWIAQAEDSITSAQEAAFRLYREAGVNERYARFFSSDIGDQARKVLEKETRKGTFDANKPSHVSLLKFVSRRSNFSREVLAAAEAAKKDKQWKEAVRKGDAALKNLDQSRRDQKEIDLEAQVRELSDRSAAARVAHSQAYKRVRNMQESLKDLRARESAGVPLQTQMHWTGKDGRALRDTIVRNPDGSTNAWVRVEEESGRRYVPIVGVTSTTRQGVPVNALVTSDGDEIVGVEHITRGPGASRARSATIVTSTPAPGAGLLAREGNPDAGYGVSVDTTG